MAGKSNKDTLHTTLEKIARILSDRYDIEVLFKGDLVCTEGRTIILPSIPEDVDPKLLEALEGYLDHEAAHLIYTQFPVMGRVSDGMTKMWLNLVEDIRVEARMQEVWRGCKNTLGVTSQFTTEEAIEKWSQIPEFARIAKGALLVGKGHVSQFDSLPDSAELLKKIMPLMPAISRAKTIPDTLHSLALAIWLTKRFGGTPQIDEEQDPALQEALEKMAGMMSEAMTPEAMSELMEELARMFGASMGGEGEEHEPGEEGEESEIPSEIPGELKELFDVDPSELEKEAAEIEGGAARRLGEKAGEYRHYKTTDKQFYLPYTTELDVVEVVESGDKGMFQRDLKEVKATSGVVMRKLRNLLVGRAAVVTEYDKQFGKLNPRSLPRMLTTGYPRVFKQKRMGEVLNCSMSILIDQSGSMHGHEITEARKAAILFGEFAHTLDIPFEILGFTTVTMHGGDTAYRKATKADQDSFTRWDQMEINIFKQFHESWRKVGNRMSNLRAKNHNLDGEAVRIAAQRLLLARRNPHERLILFAISDGLPEQCVSRYRPNHQHYLKVVVNEVLAAGVECIGIGIDTDSVERYYPNWIRINDASKLQAAQLDKLREVLLAGKKGQGKHRKKLAV